MELHDAQTFAKNFDKFQDLVIGLGLTLDEILDLLGIAAIETILQLPKDRRRVEWDAWTKRVDSLIEKHW